MCLYRGGAITRGYDISDIQSSFSDTADNLFDFLTDK